MKTLLSSSLRIFVRFFVLYLTALALSACADRDITDLEQFVLTEKKRETMLLDKLPEFPPDIIHIYQAHNKRSPFESFKTGIDALDEEDKNAKGKPEKPCLRPDSHRSREQLEASPLDTLRMVGTMTPVSETMYGLIMDNSDLIHKVEIGNYMGENHGKIISIERDRIELTEMISDGLGCFVETQAALEVTQNKK